MNRFQVDGRLANITQNLGTIPIAHRDTNLAQLSSAFEAIQNLKSLEVISDFRDGIIGMIVSKMDPLETQRISLPKEPFLGLQVKSFLTQIKTEKVCGVVSKKPIKLVGDVGEKEILGIVTAHKLSKIHSAWVALEFIKPMCMDIQKTGYLKSIASLVSLSGFDLLSRMCCLQPECDPFGLKSIKDKSELQFLPDANPRMTKMEYALLVTFRGLLDSEQSILGLMAEGKSNGEIAKILFVSDSSIRNASSRIYNKIGARNRQDAVVLHTRHQQLTSIFGD